MEQIDITIEQAIDMLPVVGEIYDKLNVQSYAEEKSADTEKDLEKLGMNFIFSHIFKKAKVIKKELIELAAIAYDVKPEEAAKMKWSKIISVIKAIKEDEDLNSFF